jgi:hypothetical protein
MAYSLAAATGAIVFDGNSLTWGYLPGWPTPYPYSTIVRNLYGRPPALAFHNVAVSAQTTAAMISRGAAFVDVLKSAGPLNVVVAWEGTNSMAQGGLSASAAFDQMAKYADDRIAAGWEVVVLTCLPRSDAAAGATFEKKRQAYNSMVRAHFKKVIDIAADLAIGQAGCQLNQDLYFADETHIDRTAIAHLGARAAEDLDRMFRVASYI